MSPARIMVVDDEDGVREVARRILSRGGYDVIAARGGEEALSLITDDGREIDLLLTDVIMPRMSGKELAERLVELRNDVKVLYMSGYTDRLIGLDEIDALVEKPFNRNVLLEAVSRKLDGQP
jgi:two-component system, cell cycle sensor histidine kinase and response regulator CckA